MTDLVLSPRDGFFLKDGREWATSQEGRAHSLAWPMPSTLLGALVTARGRGREAAGARLDPSNWEALAKATELGPTVALRRPVIGEGGEWRAEHRVWPVPADALFLAGNDGKPERIQRLDPVPQHCAVLGRDDDPAHEALWWPRAEAQAKPATPPSWWEEAAFVQWLADRGTERPCEGAFRGLEQPRNFQTHVGIDPATLAARESILFAHDVIEVLDGKRHEWAIGCRVMMSEDVPVYATLGGDRRLARVMAAKDGLFAMPPALRASFERQPPLGVRLVATTPAAFTHGWRPDGFEPGTDGVCRGTLPDIDGELILRAAFVPRAAHVSGWDMAKGGPKPTTRLVPPGAVYHFVRRDGGAFSTAEAERLWLVALGDRTREGFGRFVPGVWVPEENAT
jgi:CRISPR-associated protein Cmr3